MCYSLWYNAPTIIIIIIIIIIMRVFLILCVLRYVYYSHYKTVITRAVQVEAITAKAKENSLIAFFISFYCGPI